MSSNLYSAHLKERLKIIHLFGIAIMVGFFGLLFFLNISTTLNTVVVQYLILFMALLISISYLALLLNNTEKIPLGPAWLFVVLNILNSFLVWATGILGSPFIIFYVIIIIISTQLYRYNLGLLQMLISFLGFVIVYTGTLMRIFPYSTILLHSNIGDLYQPPAVVFVYGVIYMALFLYAVFSSSNARTVLFRDCDDPKIDITYQEKIIQELPIGIMVVDWDLNILGANPAASINFPISGTLNKLTDYLSISKLNSRNTILKLVKTCENKQLTWRQSNGEVVPVIVSARLMAAEQKSNSTFVLFLEKA
ncbi:MAG: hypothetical protein UR53_C0001G0020 [Candidatus Magasanikbacteria bacterium GW2011_GWC2_34_16]|uniref:PAS domain-containing protein n=2 Tax=Candidatus Magasanikiibacteriota TaxID=1752731 RepID=A0A0G0HFQ6_9BACT|nr:MAG: hypothetical protein UR53_C0001G0020 [Candidatus Magasanikbacteria bacterium GW2011_GWC2_34_16]KKQ41037.1 MAG: hypothetical protein US58_C0006G0016 [Candidatus Magasanikbacteria bacterium GW2011_GWA2_37_8]